MLRIDHAIKSDFEKQTPLFENTFIHNSNEELHTNIDNILSEFLENNVKFRFTARADLITFSTVWELKCTNELSIDHLIQVIIYSWLWSLSHPDESKIFKIFNIKTGEIKVLNNDFDKINTVVTEIIKGKYFQFISSDNDTFIKQCKSIF